MKRSVLFKNTSLVVQKAAEGGKRSAEGARAVLKTKHLAIPLDAAAAEVLVGYLQVMRAYLTSSRRTRQQVMLTLEQVAAHLDQQLKSYGRTSAERGDITELIQQMGCLHDWATKRAALLKKPEK